MKIFFTLLFFSNVVLAQIKESNFHLQGTIKTGYIGYIYLTYNNFKDSCLVTNNNYHFKGKINAQTSAYFSTGKPAAMEKDFYIEKGNMYVDLDFKKKVIQELELDIISTRFLKETQTSLIQKDFYDFKLKHEKDKDWNIKIVKKIEDIVTKNPKNKLSGSLLALVSWDTLINPKSLIPIYKKLNLKSQDQSIINTLELNILQVKTSLVNKKIIDFELFNPNNESINTRNYRGSFLIIDFWASWCLPCRKQLPGIKKIYEKFKDQNVKIVSVSLEKENNKWIEAINKEKIPWENVIDPNAFDGFIAQEYAIKSIPRLLLVDEQGIIISDNSTVEEITKLLTEKFK